MEFRHHSAASENPPDAAWRVTEWCRAHENYLMRESGIPSRLLPGPAGISLSTGAVPLTALATREETL
jgi:hypothetical protein